MSCALYEIMQKLEQKGQTLFGCMVPQVAVYLKQMQMSHVVMLTSFLIMDKMNANTKLHSSVLTSSCGASVRKGLVVTRIILVNIEDYHFTS